LSRLLEELTLNFMPGPTGQRLTADGEDITDAIRTPEISMLASGYRPGGGPRLLA